MLNLKTQCPELLRELPGFPVEGTGNALEDICKAIHANQKTLRGKLGMTDDQTTLEQSVETDLSKSFSITRELVSSLLSEEDKKDMDIFDNRLKSGMKVTRAIMRRVASGEHFKDFLNTMYQLGVVSSNDLSNELPKLPKASGLDILKDPMTLVQNFYSEVAAIRGKSIGFTLDPLMFIRGANSANFSSCYTIRKEFNSAAPITLGLSGSVAMIYSRDANTILGRCWVIFAPDYKSFIVLREYGFLPKEVIDTVCGWISTLLKPDVTWFRTDRCSRDLMVSHTEQGIYGDPIKRAYSYDKNDGNLVNYVPYIINTLSRCIICGKIHGESRIICSSCRSRYLATCEKCGSLMFRDNEHTVQLCAKCLGSKVICPDCGSVHDSDKECICKKKTTTCSFCGDTAIISYHGISMCATCAEIIHTKTTCEACGAEGMMYPYNKHCLCQTCFTHVTKSGRNNLRVTDRATAEKLSAILQEEA